MLPSLRQLSSAVYCSPAHISLPFYTCDGIVLHSGKRAGVARRSYPQTLFSNAVHTHSGGELGAFHYLGHGRLNVAGLRFNWLGPQNYSSDRKHHSLHRLKQQARWQMLIGAALVDAEYQTRRALRGDRERSKNPIPNRQARSQIPIEMRRVLRVVDLVVCRTHKQTACEAAEMESKSPNVEDERKHR